MLIAVSRTKWLDDGIGVTTTPLAVVAAPKDCTPIARVSDWNPTNCFPLAFTSSTKLNLNLSELARVLAPGPNGAVDVQRDYHSDRGWMSHHYSIRFIKSC